MKKLPIAQAEKILLQELGIRIFNVNEWGALMGYSRIDFHRKIRATFNSTPQQMLIKQKKAAIKRRFQTHFQESIIEAALALGYSSDKSLHDFIKRYFRLTPSQLKKQLKNNI